MDRDHRRQALDPSLSFIVQAPAGSGKTELLIQRFLVLLARVKQPESIVAITFTRKAAAEMRHRVLKALDRASGPAPNTDHEKLTWSLARAVVGRNEQMQWHLPEQPSRLRIQTIDSLCSLLVRQRPLQSQMGTELPPTENAGHLYRQAAYRTLALLDSDEASYELKESLTGLLAHLDNDYAKIVGQLSMLLGRRQDWLNHVNTKQGADLRARIEASLVQVVERTLEKVRDLFPDYYRRGAVELAQFAGGNLERSDSDSPLRACSQIVTFPGSDVGQLSIWRGFAELFLTKSGGKRKSLNKNLGFPATPDGRQAKARFKEIELDSRVLAALHALRDLPPVQFEDNQWEFLASTIDVLKEAVRQLQHVFAQEQQVDFAEIALGARNALGSDASDAFKAFGIGVRHLLVDEFQDTSQSQFGFLTQLVQGWQPEDKRTVFLVGDPMQSIYGFREAEVELFLRARRSGIGNVRLVPLNLTANFRSCPAIVDWVNTAFEGAFPDEEDALTGAVSYARSQSAKAVALASSVHVHPLVCKEFDADKEADSVLEIIEDAYRQKPDGTIAVLVRSRSHLTRIVAALRSRGTRFRALEIDALQDRAAVRDLKALWQALRSTGNRIAWLSVLRAPWCGLTLTDLKALVGEQFEESIFDRMCDDNVVAQLSESGQARLGRVRPVLRHAIEQQARLPARVWLEVTWIELGGPACLRTRTELDEACAFLDFLEHSQSGFDLNSEKLFEQNLARLFAPPDTEAGDSLQIMTIHGAKGLEFDTVILPGLSRTPRNEDPSLVRWREYQEDGSVNLIMASMGEKGGPADPLHSYLRSINNDRREHESIRLLYVAATRAKRHLHLIGHIKPNKLPAKTSLLSKIWLVVKSDFDRTASESASDEREHLATSEVGQGVPLMRLNSDWAPVPLPLDAVWQAKPPVSDSEDPPEVLPKFDWVQDLQRRVGTVVHRALMQMRAPDNLEFDQSTLTNALKAEGIADNRLKEALSRANEALRNIKSDDCGCWILKQHESDEREYEVSSVEDGKAVRRILDRTFIENGTRWIIDFKTSRHEGDIDGFLDDEEDRYREQMEGYARAMQRIDSRPIMLGLYYPMFKGWRKWSFTRDI